MTRIEIDRLVDELGQSASEGSAVLTETHISWVILFGKYTYKIKKPVRLHFLDFSTLQQRKFFCEKEVSLNKRLCEDIYLDVVPVLDDENGLKPGPGTGMVVDYAVRMRRMEEGRRMDRLLPLNAVTVADIDRLAEKIAAFHARTSIVYHKNPRDIPDKFADLATEENYLRGFLPIPQTDTITRALSVSERFYKTYHQRIVERLEQGFTRDCHGDLHTGNIFLLDSPQPFDCIEFNDDIRQVDVLNEIAFLCMDLESFGRADLSGRFLSVYLARFPAMFTREDRLLFIYYKSYRANIRAKINSIASKTASSSPEKQDALQQAAKYLDLMDGYCRQLRSAKQ